LFTYRLVGVGSRRFFERPSRLRSPQTTEGPGRMRPHEGAAVVGEGADQRRDGPRIVGVAECDRGVAFELFTPDATHGAAPDEPAVRRRAELEQLDEVDLGPHRLGCELGRRGARGLGCVERTDVLALVAAEDAGTDE